MPTQLSRALEVYEGLLHQLGLHGKVSAILLPFFALAFGLAGFFAMSMILEAIAPGRVNVHRNRKRRPKVMAKQSGVATVGEMIELDLTAERNREARSHIR